MEPFHSCYISESLPCLPVTACLPTLVLLPTYFTVFLTCFAFFSPFPISNYYDDPVPALIPLTNHRSVLFPFMLPQPLPRFQLL